jgi:hypothetical protein
MLADVARGGRGDPGLPDPEGRTAVDPVGW